MASVRDLKKNLNFVIGEIIEAVYIWELSNSGKETKQSEALIDEAIVIFDTLIKKINAKDVDNRRVHLKAINKELEEKAHGLIEKLNSL